MMSRYSDSVTTVKPAVVAKARPRPATLPAMPPTPPNTKSLLPAQNERVRTLVRHIVGVDFKGNRHRAAKALGISGTMLADFLNGTRGAGVSLLHSVQRYTKRPMQEIIDGIVDLAAPAESPRELLDAIARSTWLPETQAQLRLHAKLKRQPFSVDEWTLLGNGYEIANRAAIDREEIRVLRARALPPSPGTALPPRTTEDEKPRR